MNRVARLQSARITEWAANYPGKNIVRGYCKWYGVDPLCAVVELRELGVPISAEREEEIRRSEAGKAAARRAEKEKRRCREYMTIFINGKQKRVKCPPTIDGIPVDEFIRLNADPIWLWQNEMYEELYQWQQERDAEEREFYQPENARDSKKPGRLDKGDPDESDPIPF